MSEFFATLYDPVLAPFEVMGLGKWREWVVRAACGNVLEIGVGTGANLPYYRDVKAVAAIDPDAASLKRAAAKTNGRGNAIILNQARAEELPFADDSFDSVIGTLTFCTVADPALGLREAYRVLRKGGTFRLVEHVRAPNPALGWVQEAMTPGWKIIAEGCHLNRDTLSAVVRAGFHIRTVQKRFAGMLIGIDAGK